MAAGGWRICKPCAAGDCCEQPHTLPKSSEEWIVETIRERQGGVPWSGHELQGKDFHSQFQQGGIMSEFKRRTC